MSKKNLSNVGLSISNNKRLHLGPERLKDLLYYVSTHSTKKAMALIVDNLSDHRDESLDKYQLNAQSLVKNAEDNRNNLIKNATPQELKTKVLLRELNVAYEFQKIYYTGMGYYIVDFYLPDYNIIIEIDGSQHLNSFNSRKDRLRTENLIYIHKIKRIIRFNNDETVVDTDYKTKLILELDKK